MDAYMFQAALLCSDCANQVFATSDASEDNREDSDHFPQGPYSDGGGEADSPQHCDHCDVFLDNPLTEDGSIYIKDRWANYVEGLGGNLEVLHTWRDAYPNEWTEYCEREIEPLEERIKLLADL